MTQPTNSAAKPAPERSPRKAPGLLVLIFRLLLLGVGGGLALILGIVLAYFYPNPNPEKPLILRMLERFDSTAPVASPNSSSKLVSDTTNSASGLTPVQRQQVSAKLARLQEQMKALSDGVATLETQLGISRANETIEARMQAVSLQLEGITPNTNTASVSNHSANQVVPVSQSLFQGDKLKVTLPSDALFEESNSILRPEAGLILDKIVADLRDYPASTIRIASHTDAILSTEDNRELSFRRAKTVEQYLARALGNGYRWLVVGYGETRPLVANDSNANRQRNRRVEIAVD